jgi:glycosyltransferase involved in cell wall biosynthesis
MNLESRPEVDVCFVLEGTYPYVSGGVSTWVHQAISAMPDLSFAIHYIGAQSNSLGDRKYLVPDNVDSIEKVFIFDQEDTTPGTTTDLDSTLEDDLFHALETLFLFLQSGDRNSAKDLVRSIDLFLHIAPQVSFEQVWKHPRTWDTLRKIYREFYIEEAFASYFWNTKFIAKPIWELLRSFSRIPRARVYHSVCTGYAGFLAGVAKHQFGSPFLLSEHGIYVRERITDLLTAEWTPSLTSDFERPPVGVSLFRQAWIDFFIYLGKFCYESADHITSLFERNAKFQIEFGAEPEKIEIIPNGIKPARFESIESDRNRLRSENPQRRTVGFLGRIVTIKDVRTLIRAARLTCDALPDAEFLLVGPTDEDEDYSEGCKKLIGDLGLEDHVILTGPKKIDDALPLFDVMVLSSISEGLPFAILESFAASIPVVSTDVGACSELIFGFEGDRDSPGGIVVPIADASALAEAIIMVLGDRSLQDQYGANGKQRVFRQYQEEDVMRRFRDHYLQLGQSRNSSTQKVQK